MADKIYITTIGLTDKEDLLFNIVLKAFKEQKLHYTSLISQANILVIASDNLLQYVDKTPKYTIVLGEQKTSTHIFLPRPLNIKNLLKVVREILIKENFLEVATIQESATFAKADTNFSLLNKLVMHLHKEPININTKYCALSIDFENNLFYIKSDVDNIEACIDVIAKQSEKELKMQHTTLSYIANNYKATDALPLDTLYWRLANYSTILLPQLSLDTPYSIKRLPNLKRLMPPSWQVRILTFLLKNQATIREIEVKTGISSDKVIGCINACYATNLLRFDNIVTTHKKRKVNKGLLGNIRKRLGLSAQLQVA